MRRSFSAITHQVLPPFPLHHPPRRLTTFHQTRAQVRKSNVPCNCILFVIVSLYLCVCLSRSVFLHSVLCVYLSSSDSFPDSDSVSGQASSTTDVSPNSDTSSNLGAPEFPAANSEEGLYYQNVLLAVERWFSLFGWPSGPHPISVPHTLRR